MGSPPRALGRALVGSGLLVAVAALGASGAFCGAGPAARQLRSVALRAEDSKKSVALVKVTEENAITTASLLGGVVGVLTGGVWVGAALFTATSYLSRKEDSDLSDALKGVSTAAIETLNFGAYINDKYTVTGQISDAFSNALESSPSAKKSIDEAWSGVSKAYESVDQDVGIKDTLGTILLSGSELASQAVDKVVELNDQYKVTEQISEKLSEAIDRAKSGTAKS